ncbi:MAG: ferredoxin-type protein NapF [Gammaproteobacteria bacterium]|nr:ferredoxin-type protein NapF [Gammaproteobacteria bacterium]
MNTSISRFDFLQGKFSAKNYPIRPPWALAESDFIDICNHCGDCVKQCPTKIITLGRGRFPVVSFEYGECLLCGDCVKACLTGALTQAHQTSAWVLKAGLSTERCLAFKSVECRSCYDPCESRAIKMKNQIGTVAIPVIDESLCNGCGACYAPCPTGAIEIQKLLEPAA